MKKTTMAGWPGALIAASLLVIGVFACGDDGTDWVQACTDYCDQINTCKTDDTVFDPQLCVNNCKDTQERGSQTTVDKSLANCSDFEDCGELADCMCEALGVSLTDANADKAAICQSFHVRLGDAP